jgi:hypothetical protein
MRWRGSLSIAAVLAVLVCATPAAARQLPIPFASGGITAAATADPDEPRRPARPNRPMLLRAWRRVRSAPAAFLTLMHLRHADANHWPVVRGTRNDPNRSA